MSDRELKSYDVEINGVRTTLRLTEATARKRGLLEEKSTAKAAPKAPANKAAKAPANKAGAAAVKSEE